MESKTAIGIEALGVFDSRITFAGAEETKTRTVTLYEIEYIIDCNGITYINDIPYNMRKEMIIVAKPGQKRRTRVHVRSYYIKLAVADKRISDILDKIPDVMDSTGNYNFKSMLESIIVTADSNDEYGDVYVRSKMLELIYSLAKESVNYDERNADTNKKTIARRAEEFMQEHYDEKITLEEIAASVNLSPIYFHNLFYDVTGTTVHKYLTDKRISISHGLLLTSEMPISEIAYRCGFASQSYFNYVFKKKTGKTPGEVRRSVGEGYDI